MTSQSAQIARRQLARYEQKLNVTYLVGLPHEDLLNSLKGLPRDTIVILLTVGADGTGRLFVAPDVAAEIAGIASAPVYSPVQTLLQRGVVGGHVELFDVMGVEVADLALEILAGADPVKDRAATDQRPVQTGSIGVNSSGGTSAKPDYRPAAKSAFVSSVCGSNTAGISWPSLLSC